MYAHVFKDNPYHGSDGRFTSKDKAVAGVGTLSKIDTKFMDMKSWAGQANRQGLRVKPAIDADGLYGTLFFAKDKEGNHRGEFQSAKRLPTNRRKSISTSGWAGDLGLLE